jgi:hypothetical protein
LTVRVLSGHAYWQALRLPFTQQLNGLEEFRDAFDQALSGNE